MSKILRIALAIAFIVVFYTGELAGILFDYRGINVVPTPTWILLLFATGAANVASAFWISRADPPPAQSSVRRILGPLAQGMFPSDIPGRLLHFCVNEKLVSPALRYHR